MRGYRVLWEFLPLTDGFLFINRGLSMQLWNMIIGVPGFDAEALFIQQSVTTTHCRVAIY